MLYIILCYLVLSNFKIFCNIPMKIKLTNFKKLIVSVWYFKIKHKIILFHLQIFQILYKSIEKIIFIDYQ